MSKLISELVNLQKMAIKNIKSFSCLAIEYYKKNPEMAEQFYKLSKQEDKKSKVIQNQIKVLVSDEQMFNYIENDNIQAYSDARYIQNIYVGIKRELMK